MAWVGGHAGELPPLYPWVPTPALVACLGCLPTSLDEYLDLPGYLYWLPTYLDL